MKLAQQYSRASIIVATGVLIIASLIFYMVINYVGNAQIDRALNEEMGEVIHYVNKNQQFPRNVDFDDDQTIIVPIGNQSIPQHFIDTPFIEKGSHEEEDGRAMISTLRLNGVNYSVTIIQSKESTAYLIGIISIITGVLSILLIVSIFFTNRYILNKLWQPFYILLLQLKNFTPASNIILPDQPIKTDEFAELREAILTMANQVKQDYQNVKNFADDASHEMLTPLAIINSKLDTLIQTENLTGKQYLLLQDIYAAITKLTRLNQALLLLVKIDNKKAENKTEQNLKQIIEKKAEDFKELLSMKKIALAMQLENRSVSIDPYFGDILLNNLFSNAIRHNKDGGSLNIILTSEHLIFENTGIDKALDTNKIFNRFEKGITSEGSGLGLTIVKNVCEKFSIQISYQFKDHLHRFILNLPK